MEIQKIEIHCMLLCKQLGLFLWIVLNHEVPISVQRVKKGKKKKSTIIAIILNINRLISAWRIWSNTLNRVTSIISTRSHVFIGYWQLSLKSTVKTSLEFTIIPSWWLFRRQRRQEPCINQSSGYSELRISI